MGSLVSSSRSKHKERLQRCQAIGRKVRIIHHREGQYRYSRAHAQGSDEMLTRRQACPKPPCRLKIYLKPISGESNAIITLGPFVCDIAIKDIAAHQFNVSLPGVTKATTPTSIDGSDISCF